MGGAWKEPGRSCREAGPRFLTFWNMFIGYSGVFQWGRRVLESPCTSTRITVGQHSIRSKPADSDFQRSSHKNTQTTFSWFFFLAKFSVWKFVISYSSFRWRPYGQSRLTVSQVTLCSTLKRDFEFRSPPKTLLSLIRRRQRAHPQQRWRAGERRSSTRWSDLQSDGSATSGKSHPAQ